MSKFNKTYHIYYLNVVLFLSCIQAFSQTNYSELALTGRGELKLVGADFKLQKEVFDAYKNMQNEALKDSISIEIVSAYRSFNYQKKIWNRKYKRNISTGLSPQKSIEKIIEYSTIPGTSRHHWGTDIDIIDSAKKSPMDLLLEENYNTNGVYSKLKTWMDNNSEKYGFYLVYDNNSGRKGFKFEPWHYTYKSISKPMLKEFLLFDLVELFKNNNLQGNQLLSHEFLKKYYNENILDINDELK